MKRFRRTKEEIALKLTPKQAQARRSRQEVSNKPSCLYSDITYEELSDYVGRKTIIKVSKTWLESIIKLTQTTKPIISVGEVACSKDEKIEFKLTDLNND